MRLIPFLILLLTASFLKAQKPYFYPNPSFNSWDYIDPASLGWCVQELDTLSEFLDQTNAKGFIILHRGRIAYDEYFDSVWY